MGASAKGSVERAEAVVVAGVHVTPIQVDKRGTPYEDVLVDGVLTVRIANYGDPQLGTADVAYGFQRFMDFFPQLKRDVERGRIASLVLDSASFAALGARKLHQYALNPKAKDPRQWYGGQTDLIEEALCIQLPALPINVGVAMHVNKTLVEAEGTMVRAPLAPGRLGNMVAAAWPEVYHLYVERDAEGKKVRRIQTDTDERFQAGTIIGAVDGGRAEFERVWRNWPKDVPRPPWHGVVYGEPHVGKSTFLAGMPKPMYVAMFDGRGKDAPYRKVVAAGVDEGA